MGTQACCLHPRAEGMLGGGGQEGTLTGVSLGRDGRGSEVSLLAWILHTLKPLSQWLDAAR